MKRLICAVMGHRNTKLPIEGDVGYMLRCRRCGRERSGQLMHGEWQPPKSAAGFRHITRAHIASPCEAPVP
jgi:hypothetical protein